MRRRMDCTDRQTDRQAEGEDGRRAFKVLGLSRVQKGASWAMLLLDSRTLFHLSKDAVSPVTNTTRAGMDWDSSLNKSRLPDKSTCQPGESFPNASTVSNSTHHARASGMRPSAAVDTASSLSHPQSTT